MFLKFNGSKDIRNIFLVWSVWVVLYQNLSKLSNLSNENSIDNDIVGALLGLVWKRISLRQSFSKASITSKVSWNNIIAMHVRLESFQVQRIHVIGYSNYL